MATKTRGGRRAGAGRPPDGDAPKTRTIAFRLTEAEAGALDAARLEGESAGKAAARLLRLALQVELEGESAGAAAVPLSHPPDKASGGGVR